MVLYFTDCIKFNYSNSKSKPITLIINQEKIAYNQNKSINLKDIIGIIYGPNTTTYKYVKICKPWLTISIILDWRTYDFQLSNFNDIISLFTFIKKLKLNIFLPKKSNVSEYFKKLILNHKPNDIDYRQWFKTIKDNANILPYNNDCPICLEKININNSTLLKCGHNYHPNCISLIQKKECPLCRLPF